ncbi:hypothetical protein F5Y15DRAFT_353086 [Xylariaceae sp. FL0016]|nr:hypothetical protein F5Y15DRAFT_353086 [Xylariaceae sp. FL0016]
MLDSSSRRYSTSLLLGNGIPSCLYLFTMPCPTCFDYRDCVSHYMASCSHQSRYLHDGVGPIAVNICSAHKAQAYSVYPLHDHPGHIQRDCSPCILCYSISRNTSSTHVYPNCRQHLPCHHFCPTHGRPPSVGLTDPHSTLVYGRRPEDHHASPPRYFRDRVEVRWWPELPDGAVNHHSFKCTKATGKRVGAGAVGIGGMR